MNDEILIPDLTGIKCQPPNMRLSLQDNGRHFHKIKQKLTSYLYRLTVKYANILTKIIYNYPLVSPDFVNVAQMY